MAITAKTVRYGLRPQRLLFVAEEASLLDVVKANCSIWGGIYNPIVLLEDQGGVTDIAFRIESTARLFDVDRIVSYTAQVPESRGDFRNPAFISARGFVDSLMPVAPFLRALLRNQGALDAPELPAESLLAAARFGSPLTWNSAIPVSTRRHSVTELEDDLRWYPIQTTRYRLSPTTSHQPALHILFLVNAESHADSVEFWNLRASGAVVHPLPHTQYEAYGASITPLLQRATRTFDGGKPYVNLRIAAARGIGANQLDRFIDWYRSLTNSEPVLDTSGLSTSLPTVFTVGTATQLVVFEDGSGDFIIDPPPVEVEPEEAQKTYAADLEFLIGISDYLFWMPEPGPALRRALLQDSPDWRLGRRGLVAVQRGTWSGSRLRGATPRDVTIAAVRDAGLDWSRWSTAGLALERVVAHMGGALEDCDLLCHPGVRDLLHRLEGGADSLVAGEVMACLSRSTRNTETSQQQFDMLFSKQVLRAGLVLQCSRCARRAWYLTGTFGVSYRCQWCFAENVCPRPDQSKWHYRSDGLFMLEGKMAGCLAVLSSLVFLERVLVTAQGAYGTSKLLWIPSFEYRAPDGSTRELDFAVASPYRDRALIIGEVKSGSAVPDDEMRSLAEAARASGAYLAFCTLADEFSAQDKQRFAALSQGGVPLILLTRKHLDLNSRGAFFFWQLSDFRTRGIEQLSRTTTRQVLDDQAPPVPFGPYR